MTAPAIWTQTRSGRVVDLINPDPHAVDWREIADTLASINRFAGAAWQDISVARHTLIAVEAAVDPSDIPYILLHDAHECFIGDITRPVCDAWCAMAERIEPGIGGTVVRHSLDALKHAHDVAIHSAAGLPLPDAHRRARIRHADDIALVTERRDFLRPCLLSWLADLESLAPLPRRFGTLPPQITADELMLAFRTHLPRAAFGD